MFYEKGTVSESVLTLREKDQGDKIVHLKKKVSVFQ